MKTVKKSLALILMAVIVFACTSAAFAEKSIFTTCSCNLRSDAGLKYASITVVPKGTNLSASASRTDNRGVKWYKVKYGGKTGWVSSVYCKKGSAPLSGNAVTATGDTYIRSSGNLDGRKLDVLYKGDSATYLNKNSIDDRGVCWYKVSYRGITGWVSSTNTTL